MRMNPPPGSSRDASGSLPSPNGRSTARYGRSLRFETNRDTLYSLLVFDLDAGPVTVTLPNAGQRFMSMQVIDEDHYTPEVVYGAGTYTFSREKIGTR
jgi:hypothetical protein